MILKKEEIEQIITDAAENYDGNIRTAIAAKLHGAMIVRDCGNKEPAFSDRTLISKLKGQITKFQNATK
jgi:hypothetical protein